MKKSTLAIVIATAIVVAVVLLSRQQASKPIPEADTSSLRQTASGEVIGFKDSWGTHAWLGIPYAEAPAFTEQQLHSSGEQQPVMVWIHGTGGR